MGFINLQTKSAKISIFLICGILLTLSTGQSYARTTTKPRLGLTTGDRAIAGEAKLRNAYLEGFHTGFKENLKEKNNELFWWRIVVGILIVSKVSRE